MKIIGLNLLLLLTFLSAKIFTYDEVHKLPTGVEKDYYIWCYLKQKTTSKEQAKKIIYDISRSNEKLNKAYHKKTDGNITDEMIQPPTNVRKKVEMEPIVKVPERLSREKKREEKKKKKKKLEAFLLGKTQENRWQKKSLVSDIYIFNHSKESDRKEYFDKLLSPKIVRRLTTFEGFNKSIYIILHSNLPLLKKSLLTKPGRNNRLSSLSHFKMGIYAIQEKKYELAENYFYHSVTRAKTQWRKDKANFWLYLLSNNKKYIDKLLESKHINIYTLLAHDIANKEYAHIHVPEFSYRTKPGFNVENPIEWAKIKQQINDDNVHLGELADKFMYQNTVGIYSFIKAKAENYRTNYFPMPYKKELKHLSKKTQALIYAIARQETRFIPSSVSPSFALGMMQFMPFLVKDIAEKKSEKLNDFDMFNPKKSLEYAEFHLSYLQKSLQHPLFIGYAYNGGIGFTQKILKDKRYFKKGRFEPYLSLESIPNKESREYGKRILVNYVIYMNQLGKHIRITPLMKELINPVEADKFK